MKRVFFTLCLALPLVARAASPVGLLPEDKVPVIVDSNERNPFGKNMVKASAALVENEESRIRAIIEKYPVSAVIQGRNGWQAMVGPLTLEEGQLVAPVIARQTEKIRVVSVAQNKAELAFLESDGTPGLRRIVVTLNIAPRVQFRVVKPAVRTAGDEEAGFDGVLSKDDLNTPK
jgi:hypothetical protein